MRVVVTGGDGFAGRWLCRLLADDGAHVVAWVRRKPAAPLPGVQYRVQDIRDAPGCSQGMREDAPDQVFHLAAITHLGQAEEDPKAAHVTNVDGTHNVMAATPRGATAVFASTCHVYGPPSSLPIDESHPCAPGGTYAQTKLLAEEAATESCSRAVIARAFHHTGPGQSTQYALSDWAQKVAAGQVVWTGDLSLRRDYSDVRDICAGYRLLAEAGTPHEIYNLCSGAAPALETLLMGMGDCVQATVDPSRLRSGDIREFRGDPSKAEALGWRRSISTQQMLADLVQSFR